MTEGGAGMTEGDAGMTEGGAGMTEGGGMMVGGWEVASGRRRCSGFFFFGVFLGDPGGFPIWSGGLAVFGFVQVCSDLFRVIRGVLEGLAAGVDAGGVGVVGVGAVLLCSAGVWGWGGG